MKNYKWNIVLPIIISCAAGGAVLASMFTDTDYIYGTLIGTICGVIIGALLIWKQ